jgi:hypothetical protein
MRLFNCEHFPAVMERCLPLGGPKVCAACAKRRRHAERMRKAMRIKRAVNPAYREDERKKVLARMRSRRKALHAEGRDCNGKPYKTPVRAVYAALRSGVTMGKGALWHGGNEALK